MNERRSRRSSRIAGGKGPALPFWRGMLVICAVALIARVVMLAQAWRVNPLASHPIEDAKVYWNWAAMIASGQLLGARPFHSAPLYAYVLGLIRSLGGDLLTVYAVQIGLYLMTAVLIGRIGYRRFGAPTGLLAAALFAALTEPAFYAGRVLNSTWQIFLVAALWTLLIEAHERGSTGAWLATGALVGLNCLANPTMLSILVLLGPWAYLQGTRGARGLLRAGAAVAAASILIAPAAIHNYRASGEFIPISAQAGLTFYQGNCPGAQGTYTKVAGVSGDRQVQNLDALRNFQRATGREGSWGGASRFYFEKGLAYWASNPWNALRLLARKFYWFVTGRNYGDIYIPSLEKDAGLSHWQWLAPLPTAWLILPALLSLLAMLPQFRRYLPELVLFAVPLAVVCLFWYSPRYRLPVVPVVAVAAAWTFCRAVQSRKRRFWPAAATAAIVLAIGLGEVNRAVGFDDVASCRPAFEHSLGLTFAEMGDLEEARGHFEKALELSPGFAPALSGLGDVLRKMGRQDDAIETLEEALRLDPDSAPLQDSLSKNLRERGRLDEAIAHARRAVELEPDQAEFHNDLAIALAENKEAEEAIRHFDLALQANPMKSQVYLNLALLFAELGRQDEALRCCADAVRLDRNLAQAHGLAGMILFERGQRRQGIDALQSACRADPADPVYPAVLAWNLATNPDASPQELVESLRLARQADEITKGRDLRVLDTLAIALAANGRFEEAQRTVREAIELATRLDARDLLPILRERLGLYEQGKPYVSRGPDGVDPDSPSPGGPR